MESSLEATRVKRPKHRVVRLTCFAVVGATLLTAYAASEDPAAGSAAPAYTEAGDLKRPEGFETWVFVGSSLGLQYRSDVAETTTREKDRNAEEVGDFHNVYINPGAYEHYAKTGEFPDKTVLVMDVYEARERDPAGVVSKGRFPADHRQVEVAVKNRVRPDGSTTDWAYYAFPPGKDTAKAFPDAACYDCHRKHAAKDNVWVQFYPTLRDGGG